MDGEALELPESHLHVEEQRQRLLTIVDEAPLPSTPVIDFSINSGMNVTFIGIGINFMQTSLLM